MTEEEFWAALQPVEPQPIIYRLYHDQQGLPLFFSQEDLPGKYIDIDRDTYVNPPTHMRVVDGKIVVLNTNVVTKLTPTRHGTACHPQDICVVVDKTLPHITWDIL
jgi:hypothetical protein